MTRDAIIRMAREAGWTGPEENVTYVAMLERFANLVAAAEREANKDRIETLYQMNKMASQQRDELMQQQADALRARLAQPEQQHSEQWWRHEVSNAWAEGYEKGRLQREWQGLTDEEIREFEIWLDDEEEKHGWNPPADIVKYIEAKLKEKNGG
jgi:hypothetical protein